MPLMRSIVGEEVYVATEDGMHCTRIGKDWVMVEDRFAIPAAATRKCIVKFEDEDVKAEAAGFKRKTIHETIVEKISEMIADPKKAEHKYFTKETGMPNLKKLSVLCEFVVEGPEMLAAWQEIQQAE